MTRRTIGIYYAKGGRYQIRIETRDEQDRLKHTGEVLEGDIPNDRTAFKRRKAWAEQAKGLAKYGITP